MKKQITKLLAVAMSATLFIQPITAFAVEEAPAPEIKVEEAAPAEDSHVNDNVENKVDAAETAIVEALPPAQVEQTTTDEHLEESKEAVEAIEGSLEGLEALNAEAVEKAGDYFEEVGNVFQEVGQMNQAVGETLWEGPFIIGETYIDYKTAEAKADEVVDIAGREYGSLEEAKEAKEGATIIAQEAQDAADRAKEALAVIEEDFTRAETAKEAAETDLADAQEALDAANDAVELAEAELARLREYYGVDKWGYNPGSQFDFWGTANGDHEVKTAIEEAEAAVAEAKRLQGKAISDFNAADKAYSDANQAYNDAEQAVQDARDNLNDAEAAVEAANALADIIAHVNEVEQLERNTYNELKDIAAGHGYWAQEARKAIEAEDIKLAQALLEFKFYNKQDIKVERIGNSKNFIVTYKENGHRVSGIYSYEVDTSTQTVDDHPSTHWLKITQNGMGGSNVIYTEIEYYNNDRNAIANAQAELDRLNKIINETDLDSLLEDKNQKESDKNAADTAKQNAISKLGAVQNAYNKVIDAAKALKNLKSAQTVSENALKAAQTAYDNSMFAYNIAKAEFMAAAEYAGLAQDEADRAFKAIEDGFAYLNPQPGPNPNPTPGPGPSEPTTEEATPYVAPVAVTTPVAPAAEEPAAVLGETRARGRGTGAAVEEEAIGDGEEKIEDGEGEKKIEEEEKKDEAVKPAVTINDEDTARAAAPIAEKKGFPWWILIILAIIVAVSIEEYNRRKNKEENIQE